jgi:hypothetical protein
MRWQVRSRLGLALGPNTAQTIQRRTEGKTVITDLIKLYTHPSMEDEPKTLKPADASTDWLWNIKANTLLIQPSGIVEVDVEQVKKKKLPGLQFMLYEPKPIQLLPDGPNVQNITLKNYQDNYTLMAIPTV